MPWPSGLLSTLSCSPATIDGYRPHQINFVSQYEMVPSDGWPAAAAWQWQSFLDAAVLQQEADKAREPCTSSKCFTTGTAQGWVRCRVVSTRTRTQMWCYQLQVTVPACAPDPHCRTWANVRIGETVVSSSRQLGRRFPINNLVVQSSAGDTDRQDTMEMPRAVTEEQRQESVASEDKDDSKIGIAEGAVNIEEKILALNDLELQPSIRRRGWLAQIQMAWVGFLGNIPMLPVQEVYVEIPRLPPPSNFVWEGWGTSLCWWANFVGGLNETDMDFVMDLIFDQAKGLGFNIARYNIGGGADLKFDTNIRPFADIPGFKAGIDAAFDWSVDTRQRRVLLGAKARGANLFEAFSNSPPGWMTHSGSVTGNWKKGQDNLKPEYYAAFADYLTEVVHQYEREWGMHFNFLAPFNEPVEGFWNLDRKKAAQEGCNFEVSSLRQLIPHVHKSLSRKGLSTQITAVDSWSMNAPRVLKGLGKEALDAVSQINVHTYKPYVQMRCRRTEVRKTVSKLGKRLWMSEYGPQGVGGSELDVALAVGKHIVLDINHLQPSAWCYWQAVEIPGKNFYWGLLHMDFLYDPDRTYPVSVQIKKQYYMMMHFSRWIRPGFTIFPSEGEFRDWVVMAVDGSTKAVAVLVLANTANRNIDINFDVSGIAPGLSNRPVQAALFRTSNDEDHKELPSIDFLSSVILVRVIARSITTIIVSEATRLKEGVKGSLVA